MHPPYAKPTDRFNSSDLSLGKRHRKRNARQREPERVGGEEPHTSSSTRASGVQCEVGSVPKREKKLCLPQHGVTRDMHGYLSALVSGMMDGGPKFRWEHA
jgi:hypothetical protein